ncbi:DNA recombination protein RmuC [Maricaulis salignorans]|uniref:DNA recombination protein RmuC homolog n=1 Tax=Maricaulis salignorans TaxID=144026 RepID=A0A1G9ND11_9PROT|nr:DNA recombination protein RmuC [Maricaulis salignorans]SDL83997.1 DNA recombination protein RmuC [Maricaulis salignorans]
MDIASLLLLAGLGIVLVLLVVILVRKPAESGAVAAAQVEELKLERDELRSEADRQSAALSEARQALARIETAVEERDRLREKLEAVETEKGKLDTQFASLRAEHDAAIRHHDEKLAELEKAREKLTETFKSTAAEILKTSGAEMNKQGAEGLQVLLKPLREQLDGFQKRVIDDAEKRMGQTTEIKTLIQTLHSDARQMSDDAKGLVNALRSSGKVQGDWGEMVLATILERAGLREGQEFFTQQSETTDDGARRRPDVVVEMPGKQRLVIDSKVSLTAFERCVNAEDEDARGVALKQHINSVRTHIKALGDKDYAQFYEGVDFTLMFIPLEGAASLALQNDPEISIFAGERNVMIATPTTLMMAMRTVHNLWTIDRQNQNAREIASRAGSLYDKFEGFIGDLEKVGQRIDAAKTAWHDAKGKLSEGRGNLVRQTEMLKQLGAGTKKSLPDDYLEAAGLDTEEESAARPALTGPDAAD